jgi:hypothetical protein
MPEKNLNISRGISDRGTQEPCIQHGTHQQLLLRKLSSAQSMNLKKRSRDASASTDNSAKTEQAKSGTYSQTEKIDENNLGKHSPIDVPTNDA